MAGEEWSGSWDVRPGKNQDQLVSCSAKETSGITLGRSFEFSAVWVSTCNLDDVSVFLKITESLRLEGTS